MPDIKIEKFRAEHALSMGSEMDLAYWQRLESAGPCVSIRISGDLVAAGGIGILWQGVGEGWMLTTEKILTHRLAFHRTVLKVIDMESARYGLRRIQATVLVGFTRAIRYIEALGFAREGVLRKYGPNGSDYYLYAKVAS